MDIFIGYVVTAVLGIVAGYAFRGFWHRKILEAGKFALGLKEKL